MKKRIIGSLALIFVLFLAGSLAVVYNLSSTTARLRHLISLHEIEDIRQDLNLSVQRVLTYVHASEDVFTDNINEVIQNCNILDEAIERCYSCHHRPAIQKELDAMRQLGKQFQNRLSYLITTVRDSPWRQRNQREADITGTQLLHKVQDMVNRAALTIQDQTTLAMSRINRSHTFIALTLIITLLVALAIAQYLILTTVRPIEALLTATRRIADGELGYETDYKAPDEFGELIATFNAMSRSLAEKEAENRRLTTSLEQKIQELEQTQRQLVETEKLTALGTLAGGIAHDFNNILCGIISNITVLKRGQRRDTSQYALLETIEQAGFRAADLVQQLLTFARQGIGTVQMLSVNTHVNNIIKLLQASLPPSIGLSLELEKDLPQIAGDPTRLEQVIMNLCLNARDAMPNGGELTIRTSTTELDDNFRTIHPEARPGRYVTIDIADTGEGMDEQVKARIFEPFFTTKPFGKGTGLGLAIVHGIVKSHQGFCIVETQPGQGSRFTIYLPVDSPLIAHAGEVNEKGEDSSQEKEALSRSAA